MSSDIPHAPEEVLSTLRHDGTRRWIYPTLSKGRFYHRRLLVGWGLIVFFLGLPVVKWNGLPLVWLDVGTRRFVIFGQTFYATDTPLLMLLGLICLAAVAWLTALFGRVWCGWGCPQTVYLEFVYRPIERFLEGKESARRKHDSKPMTGEVWRKKALKHGIFFVISAILAHSFLAYFISWDRLIQWMIVSPREHWTIFLFTTGLTGLIFFDFAYFREQMCTVICPYAKLQSVLLDSDSLLVSYDPVRGEPRGKRTKGVRNPLQGDCIDCGACVRTCPTGIDIRDGLQMECIGCTQCIDACDDIMDRIGQPRGLIRYTSERALERKRTRWVRARVVLYTGALVLLCGLFFWGVSRSSSLEVQFTRPPEAPFVSLPDGQVANHLKVKLLNRTAAPLLPAFEVVTDQGEALKLSGPRLNPLDPGAGQRIDVWITAPAKLFAKEGSLGTMILIKDGLTGDEQKSIAFTLIGPQSP